MIIQKKFYIKEIEFKIFFLTGINIDSDTFSCSFIKNAY